MKTLIIYGTKHGFAEKCAGLLKDKLQGEVTIVNVSKGNVPDIRLFDNIIVGGSTYMGQIQKEVKSFCSKNLNLLKDKRVGIFICGMNNQDLDAQLNNSFPEELLANAIAKEHFGGEVVFRNINFFERFIMKKVGKIDKDTSRASEENIDKFSNMIKCKF
ncbi:flavodoxin domain-containing protein [Clostridiaceae bacterium UIB06]|nr:flavodoxin domain-containing protein [Clostridiaceae bacterium UIB06]